MNTSVLTHPSSNSGGSSGALPCGAAIAQGAEPDAQSIALPSSAAPTTATAATLHLSESHWQIGGMHCAACVTLIETALHAVPGLASVVVNPATQRATLRWDPARTAPAALVQALKTVGYSAWPDEAGPARSLRAAERRLALWRLFVAGFCAMQVMMFTIPMYLATEHDMPASARQLLGWGAWLLSLPVMAFSARPFFAGALRSLRARQIGMDVPVALGLAITFVVSTAATFDPGGLFGAEAWFDSLTMFIAVLLASRWIEMGQRHRAAEELEATLTRLPDSALRIEADGQACSVPVSALRPGDRVRVPQGQAFAADGPVLQGHTQADESLLTGEARPVAKAPGSMLIGGSLNLGAPIEMRVERTGQDTRWATIVELVRSAASQRPPGTRWADRWAAPFLWTVLALAAAGGLFWSFIDPARAPWVVVSVLIVTCPCALSLAAPLTWVAATRALARHGVLLRRLDALDGLARCNRAFFDKTGTLTEGRVLPLGSVPAAVLARAASLARWSSHPLARSLASSLSSSSASPLSNSSASSISASRPAAIDPADEPGWTDVQEQAGAGLSARDADGATWRLGSAAWVGAEVGTEPSAGVPTGIGEEASADAVLWLARDGQVLARFGLDEVPRPGVAQAMAQLQAAGVATLLLSGDSPARVQALAHQLGMAAAQGGALPQDKLAVLAAAQARGDCVLMVGDGINDAPVLARADVSLAMGQGALLARQQADAVLLGERIGEVVQARRIAQRALAIVRQNLFGSALYNLSCVPLALLGLLPPWAASIGMAGSSLLVVLNASRAGRP